MARFQFIQRYCHLIFQFLIISEIGRCASGNPEISDKTSPSTQQLLQWASRNGSGQAATNLHGRQLPSLTASETVGPRGEILLQDFHYMEKMAAFVRERVPERVVHAKGTGAHGYLQINKDISHLTRADFLNGIGKKTPVFCRLSTAIGGLGSADTAPDQHGFACKFYTQDGIHDILSLSIEPFSIRDPMSFPDLNRSRKKNPVTGQTDFDAWWDFVSLRPETTHHIMHLFSDRGRPDGYRVMDAFAVNVFKFVNKTGGVVLGKFHFRSEQPWRALTYQEAEELAGSNPEYKTQDLYDAIERGDYPGWGLYLQIMTLEETRKYPSNPFDPTRRWLETEFPLIPVGRMVLNRNPSNMFAEMEQVAFAPSNMVPGIHPTEDRILGGRIFAYQDAQRYRGGGPNFMQLPINRPTSPVRSYQRDGPHCHGDNGGGAPNFFPNSHGGPQPVTTVGSGNPPFSREGIVGRYDVQEDDNFDQSRYFLENEVGPEERKRLVESLADWLKNARAEIRERVLRNNFYPISKKFGDELREAVEVALVKKSQPRGCWWKGQGSVTSKKSSGWGRTRSGSQSRDGSRADVGGLKLKPEQLFNDYLPTFFGK